MSYCNSHIAEPTLSAVRGHDMFEDYQRLMNRLPDLMAPFDADRTRIPVSRFTMGGGRELTVPASCADSSWTPAQIAESQAHYLALWRELREMVETLKWHDYVHSKAAATQTVWRYDNGVLRLVGSETYVTFGARVPRRWIDTRTEGAAVIGMLTLTDDDSRLRDAHVVEVLLVKDPRTASQYEDALMRKLWDPPHHQ